MGKLDDVLARCFIDRKYINIGDSLVFTADDIVTLYMNRIGLITATFDKGRVIKSCCINFILPPTALIFRRINVVLALLHEERYLKYPWKAYTYRGGIYLSSTGKSLRKGGIQIGQNKIDIISLDVERSRSLVAFENIHTLSAEDMIMALV